MNSNESSTKLLKYQEEGHLFKSLLEVSSELVVHHRRRGVSKVSFTAVNNSYCVTSFNIIHNVQGDSLMETSLVICDLRLGEVVHRISQLNTTVNMTTNTLSITQHPKHEHIFVTTDVEGQIIFWDCSVGCAIRIFNEKGAHLNMPLMVNAVSDCNFSKCGNFLAVGSNMGSFSIYGYGGSEWYEHTEVEQFTSTDYIRTELIPETYEILNSDTGLVIGKHDEGTFNCNFNMTPHLRLEQDTDYPTARITLDERAVANRYRCQELKKVDLQLASEVEHTLENERRRAAEVRRRFRESAMDPRAKEKRPEEVVPEVLPSGRINPLIGNDNQLLEEEHSEDKSEDRGFRRLRRQRRSESSISSRDLTEEGEEDEMEELDDSQEEQGYCNRRRSTRLTRNAGPYTLRANRGIGMNLRSTAQGNVHLGKRDIIENSDDDSADFYQNFGRGRKVDRGRETPVIEEELFCTRCNRVGAREKCDGEGCTNTYHQNCSDLCGADVRDKFYCFDCLLRYYEANPAVLNYRHNQLDDCWLDMDSDDPDFIAPQLDDEFYFVFQPYEAFVSKFFNLLNFQRGEEFWPWRRFPVLTEKEVKCRVVDIQFEFPTLRGKKMLNEFKEYLTLIMKIKLKIIDESLESISQDDDLSTFDIKYFPVNDMPSFLVWYRTYEKRVREYHLTANYSEIKSGEEFYHIKEKSYKEESFPGSLFQSIRARPLLDGISTRRKERSDAEGGTLM